MKINWHLINYDLLDEVSIPQCPSPFRAVAENIVRVVAQMTPFSYSRISIFDKHLIIEYWRVIDGLDKALAQPATFTDWFLKSATSPENILRARRWLMEHNYLIAKPAVGERAQEAGKAWGATITG